MSERDELLEVAALATDLLIALQPWELHGDVVRSAAARLTVRLAALPEREIERVALRDGPNVP